MNLKQVLVKSGLVSVALAILHYSTSLVMTPVRLIQSLWASRILLNGTWGDYPHFDCRAALTAMFYWTRALNLYRFGRGGHSPYLGLGNYNLARCFHYSLFSLYAYWGAGAVTVLCGMFAWWLSHLIWLYQGYVDVGWLAAVMGIALASTTFYANLFVRQNYNVVGWAFFPVGLYGLLTGQWLIAGMAWLTVSFGSFTLVVVAGGLSVMAAILPGSFAPLLAVAPAALKLLTHFLPSLSHSDFGRIFTGLLKAIGVTDRNVKYRRTHSKSFLLPELQFLAAYLQFAGVFFALHGELPFMFLVGVLIFVVNEQFVRFADEQTVHMLVFSLATATALQRPEPWMLLSFWLLANPLPYFRILGFPRNRLLKEPQRLWKAPQRFEPFNIRPLLQAMGSFLSPLKPGEKALMAFDDPQGVYENVFDGYRSLLEPALYVAAEKGLHLLPDWWGVFDLNYQGAPDFWGRDLDAVKKNLKHWQADYLVVYQATGTALEGKWLAAGFSVVRSFDWRESEQWWGGMKRPFSGEVPTWWLLRKPSQTGSSGAQYLGIERGRG